MPRDTVRTTIDIPAPVYRRLKEKAAQQGCTIPELVARGIDQMLLQPERPRRRVKLPLFGSGVRKVKITNQQIYGGVEFP